MTHSGMPIVRRYSGFRLLLLGGLALAAGFDLLMHLEARERRAQAAPSGGTFVPLFDGTLKGWTVENGAATSFVPKDGILRVEAPAGWLRSAREYRDFTLRTEVRFVTPDADSGIFMRAIGSAIFMRGWPGDSYQVQVRVPTAPGPLPPLGGLFRHGTPQGTLMLDRDALGKAFTGIGQWQRLQVDLRGRALRVRVNDVEVSRADDIVERSGYIGLQSETGVVEYRGLEIQE